MTTKGFAWIENIILKNKTFGYDNGSYSIEDV